MNTATKILPEVRTFLSENASKAYIGGKWVSAEKGLTFKTYDPGSGELLAEVPNMGIDDIDKSVDAATKAFQSSGWAEMEPEKRNVYLNNLADALEQHKSIIVQIESLDAGKILAQAEGDVENFIDTLRYYIKLSLEVQQRTPLNVEGVEASTVRFPWGPCGFIIPWNFPMILVGWGISPALASGNTVIIKPAEDTPLSALYLAKLSEEVGIPDGVINVVTGLGETAGAALANHPGLKKLSFTGSPEVGKIVAEACAKNLIPVKLELGGKGAAIVFDDVDVEATATDLVNAITFHSGQVCCDATRWIVHESIFDRFTAACVEKMKNIKIGHQLDSTSQMGPVVSSKQQSRIKDYIKRGQDEGAAIVPDSDVAIIPEGNGSYVKPTLLSGSLDNVAAREEIFGPVAFITPFDNEEQGIALVNNTEYGLANSVWSKDLDRARRVAEKLVAGNSWINAHNLFYHGVPYGGINKSGLGGGVLSSETFMDYFRGLSVVRPL